MLRRTRIFEPASEVLQDWKSFATFYIMWKRRRWQQLAGVFALFFVLFNYPILTIFDRGGQLWGFSRLYGLIFALWLAMIGLMAWLVERK